MKEIKERSLYLLKRQENLSEDHLEIISVRGARVVGMKLGDSGDEPETRRALRDLMAAFHAACPLDLDHIVTLTDEDLAATICEVSTQVLSEEVQPEDYQAKHTAFNSKAYIWLSYADQDHPQHQENLGVLSKMRDQHNGQYSDDATIHDLLMDEFGPEVWAFVQTLMEKKEAEATNAS